MPVATLEELDTLPQGARVNVGGSSGQQVWEKVEDNLWSYDGTAVKAANFVGVIAAGTLSVVAPVTAGDLFLSARTYYLVLGVRGQAVTYARWRLDSMTGVAQIEMEALLTSRRVTPESRPAWYEQAKALGVAAYDAGVAVAEQVTDTPVVSAELRDALHSYAVRVDDVEFDNLLGEYEIGRVADHVCHVKITGYSYYDMPWDDAAEWLNGEVTIDEVETITVNWSRTVDIVKRGVGCQCGEVNNADVEPYLPTPHTSFDFEVEHD